MTEVFDIHQEMTDEELTAHFNAIIARVPLRRATLKRSFVCTVAETEEDGEAVLDHCTGQVLKLAEAPV